MNCADSKNPTPIIAIAAKKFNFSNQPVVSTGRTSFIEFIVGFFTMVEFSANHPMASPLSDVKADVMAMANAFRAASVRLHKTLRNVCSRSKTIDIVVRLLILLALYPF